MKCSACRTDNPDDSKFCKECASPLLPSDDVTITQTLQNSIISPGKTIAGKYKILSEIGRGGMGVVYKAKDTRLKRTVALKFLPAELTKDKEAKKRFIQEAQAAAALSRPNITVIHEVDETEGQTFIAMEYIEGQSLKDKLQDGPLGIDEAKDIAFQVAEGLKEAHKKGIVHRDIKPANIMINDEGQVKITDFGLAKLSWGVDLTKTSTIMGTVAYMSPEQARGEDVDHRTDIWSLGAMLYEILTGERPFIKDHEQALIFSILNDEPKPVTSMRSDVPTHIEQVIEKALAKKASDRYSDVQGLIQELKPSITFPKTEKSIVVLPFENLSPDPDQEYFCDGMTEEIISDLSKVQVLKVISRSSAMTFKGTKKKIRDIAKDVNVQYVLEGSVRKAGNNLRITAQLIEAANDVHLWAEKYGGTLDDVFDIQEKVSRAIVESLKLELSPEESRKITERPIEDITAYDCFLRARQAILHLSKEGLHRALQLIQTGLDITGENELFNALLGYVYVQYVNVGVSIDESYLKQAEDCVNKAFSINQDSSLAHSVMGQIHWKHGKIQEAVVELKKTLAIEPNNYDGLCWLAWIYLFSGKVAVARPLVETLVEIDPLMAVSYLLLGNCDLLTGKFEDSIQYYSKAVKLEPKNPLCRFINAEALICAQKFKEAFNVIDLMAKEMPQEIFTELLLFYKYALQKRKPKTRKQISDKLKTWAARDEVISIFVAECYALLDEKEEAITWIEHGVRWGFINYPFLNEYDPLLENIRGEPRFKKLMERVKHEWENFEV